MNLSKRLTYIVNNIQKSESLMDIGTDHGYLPIYLRKKNFTSKIIATDISSKCMNKAIANSRRYKVNDIDFRVGYGLVPLGEKEKVQVLTISGIGSKAIIQIIENDYSKFIKFNKVIFIPSKDPQLLREYLYKKNYLLIEDIKIYDKKNFYSCLVFKKSNGKDNYYSKLSFLREFQFYYGKFKEVNDNPDSILYVKHKINKIKNIEKKINTSKFFLKRIKLKLLVFRGKIILKRLNYGKVEKINRLF